MNIHISHMLEKTKPDTEYRGDLNLAAGKHRTYQVA
jgi:hypothetical protein